MTKSLDIITLSTKFTPSQIHMETNDIINSPWVLKGKESDFFDEATIEDGDRLEHHYKDLSPNIHPSNTLPEEERLTRIYAHRIIGEDKIVNSDFLYVVVFLPPHLQDNSKTHIALNVTFGGVKGCMQFTGNDKGDKDFVKRIEVGHYGYCLCTRINDYDKSYFDSMFAKYLH